MKQQFQPRIFPLVLVSIGSLLLAVPGAYGAIFLFMFAAEGAGKNPLSLLIPLPALIGFGLLFGYFWTLIRMRFVGWLWLTSLIFNALITMICFSGAFYFMYQESLKSAGQLIFFLFPLWTLFVTIASGYYYFYQRSTSKISLP